MPSRHDAARVKLVKAMFVALFLCLSATPALAQDIAWVDELTVDGYPLGDGMMALAGTSGLVTHGGGPQWDRGAIPWISAAAWTASVAADGQHHSTELPALGLSRIQFSLPWDEHARVRPS